MPDIEAGLDFLANIPLYQTEKPFLALLSPDRQIDPEIPRSNLQWEHHDRITIRDMREDAQNVKIEKCGFQFVNHESSISSFEDVLRVEAYKRETETLLAKELGAERVVCYDFRLRENIAFDRQVFDLSDPLLVEGAAQGAHNDVTVDSGPAMIARHLDEDHKALYLKPGYRFRIVNTWRTLNDTCLDRPLALCDFRSIDPEDLIPADRILPNRAGEVYYLNYNPNQEWYWLERQNAKEPFIFVMYDTEPGTQARYCPHVSFKNDRAPMGAAPRRSVETRSIVISRSSWDGSL